MAGKKPDQRNWFFGWLLCLLATTFVAAAACVYLIDYQLLPPAPTEPSNSATQVRVKHFSQTPADQARRQLGLAIDAHGVESFTVIPGELEDYREVPAAGIRILFCGGLPSDAVCTKVDGSAFAFRLNHVVHFDRSWARDSWDFVFVPVGGASDLRFIYRSNTGDLGGGPDDWAFVLGNQGESVGDTIDHRIARVRGFGDSRLAAILDDASDRDAESWWGRLPGGFQRFHPESEGFDIEQVASTTSDIWRSVEKVGGWFAIFGVVLGIVGVVATFTGVGGEWVEGWKRIHSGIAMVIGFTLGIAVGIAYFVTFGAGLETKSRMSADTAIAKVLSGQLDEARDRATEAHVEVTGLSQLIGSLPRDSALTPARATQGRVGSGVASGTTTVYGPLAVRARAGGNREWKLEVGTSVVVDVYQGPVAVATKLEIDSVRAFRVPG